MITTVWGCLASFSFLQHGLLMEQTIIRVQMRDGVRAKQICSEQKANGGMEKRRVPQCQNLKYKC